MKKWKKIIFNKSNKITKVNKLKNFIDFAEDSGSYSSNQYYENKFFFFKFYLNGRYLIWDKYLKSNLNPKDKTLSIASGRGINELALISDNFDIICSDLEIPECYPASKNLFKNLNYIKFDVLKDKMNEEINSIFSLSTFFIFSDSELKKIFDNINKILKKDGTLIVDFGGAEDNLISFFFHDIYLVIEAYLVYYLSKILNKKIGLKFDNNFGYRIKNHEIVEFANKFGFELIELNECDYLSELQRSILIRKVIKYFPSSRKFFAFLGKKVPYIRMFKFKKT